MLNKLGSFLLLVGGIFLVLFILSIAANAVDLILLALGGLILLFGSFFHWISPRKESSPSDRFHTVKKIRSQINQKNKKR